MTGTYYVVWDCSYTPIESNKTVQVGAYVLKRPKREGIGPEQEAVKLLSLTVDEIGSSGGGIYVIENDVVGSLQCKPDEEFVRPEF